MSKVSKEIKLRIDQLNDEQLDRKVDHLRKVIPELNEELDYAARIQRDRRKAAQKAALEEALRHSR